MRYGEIVPGVDLDVLLRAIAQVETNGGRNNWPRVERSYMPLDASFTVQGHILIGTGKNVNGIVLPRWAKWGLGSAASWGPWQILYHTAADLAYMGPPHLLFDSATSEPFVVKRLQKIAASGAATIRDFADAWNSGSWRDANNVPAYTATVEKVYSVLNGIV